MRITLNGHLQKGVYAKDLILHIIGRVGADFAAYRGVCFEGSLIGELSVSERMALCNMTTEMGAKATYIQPDRVTMEFLAQRHIERFTVYETDAGYQYCEDLVFDAGLVAPQVAVPFSVDNVADLTEHAGTPLQQAFLGSCTGGRLEDIEVAARILKGRHIAENMRMLVVPASKKVLQDAIAAGYITDLIEAGCALVSPGCAACLGTHEGLLAEGESCISSTNRNFPGRMGHKNGRIYLASPAAVAASALTGAITDPRDYL